MPHRSGPDTPRTGKRQGEGAGKKAEFDLLKSLTEQEALQTDERQRIFRGVCKMIGGAMKVVPVGQPYLGLAGDVASNVGDINFTDPEAIPKQVDGPLQDRGHDRQVLE
jgi:hypothetical protein